MPASACWKSALCSPHPYCGKLLADAGADVIKLEPPSAGDPARRYGPWPGDIPHPERSGLFLYLNGGKAGHHRQPGNAHRTRHPGRRLAAASDAVVHNIPPADLERLGLDYDDLAAGAGNPDLVMASISPWGLSGPWRDYKAYDINLAAAGGICEGLGAPDREPLTFGAPSVGYFAGMAAASSIVMALLGRDAHGGQHIDIAEAETMAGLYNGPEALMAVYQWARHPPHRASRPGLSVSQLHPALPGRAYFRGLAGRAPVAPPAGGNGQPGLGAAGTVPQPHRR